MSKSVAKEFAASIVHHVDKLKEECRNIDNSISRVVFENKVAFYVGDMMQNIRFELCTLLNNILAYESDKINNCVIGLKEELDAVKDFLHKVIENLLVKYEVEIKSKVYVEFYYGMMGLYELALIPVTPKYILS